MFCPECGSELQNGYCPRCRVAYPQAKVTTRVCPHCNKGTMVLEYERTAALLFLPVGVKSKVYKCTICGYEVSERNVGTMRNDKEVQQAKKDIKDEIKKKVKKAIKKL